MSVIGYEPSYCRLGFHFLSAKDSHKYRRVAYEAVCIYVNGKFETEIPRICYDTLNWINFLNFGDSSHAVTELLSNVRSTPIYVMLKLPISLSIPPSYQQLMIYRRCKYLINKACNLALKFRSTRVNDWDCNFFNVFTYTSRLQGNERYKDNIWCYPQRASSH